MKMRKDTFKIWARLDEGKTGWKTKEGLVSEHFAINKDEHGPYNITHLNTGCRMNFPGMQLKQLKDARKIVSRFETADIPWNDIYIQNIGPYKDELITIIEDVLKIKIYH